MTTPGIRRRSARWPWWLAGITALAGVSLSFGLALRRAEIVRREARAAFVAEAAILRAAVEREAALFVEVLESVRQLHAISDQIRVEDFEEFLEKGMAYHRALLGGFGFAQRMTQADRLMREQPGGPAALTVTEWASGALGLRVAGARAVYYPLTYQSRGDRLGVPVGFDFGSQPDTLVAIGRMYHSRTAVIAGAMPHQTGSSGAVWVLAPIFTSATDGGADLLGFAVAPLLPAHLLARAYNRQAMPDVRLALSPDGVWPGEATSTTPVATAWDYRDTVRVADQDWAFRCRAPDTRAAGAVRRQALTVALVGFGLTLFVTTEFLLVAVRARRTESQIAQRTAELRAAKLRLEDEMAERRRLEREALEAGHRERVQLGQDLHDSLGQQLAGAAMLGRALAGRLAIQAPNERAEADRLADLLKTAVAQARRIARGLAPLDLGEVGLGQALRRLGEDIQTTYAVPVTINLHPSDALPTGAAAMHLYLIAQEAIGNAVRHARPAQIRVTLDKRRLLVEDDGQGLPARPTGGGMGLRIMRHRAATIGATLVIEPAMPKGTRVCATATGDDWRAADTGDAREGADNDA